MGINEVIVYLMLAFAVLGALDKIIGNRFGLGEKFEEGIMAIGALSLSMVGMIVLAPVLANVLSPVVVPVFEWIGADPGMFAGCILANDMGGAPLAAAMAQRPMPVLPEVASMMRVPGVSRPCFSASSII